MGGRRHLVGLGVVTIVLATLPAGTAAVGADADSDTTLVVSGRLETIVADDFDRHRARTGTTLVLRDGTRLDVRRTPGLPDDGRISATVVVDDDRSRVLSTRSAAGLQVARSLDEPVRLTDVQVLAAEAAAAGQAHQAYVAVVGNHGSWSGGSSESALRPRVEQVLTGWEVEAGDALPSFEVAAWEDVDTDSGCGLTSFWDTTEEVAAEAFPGVDFQLAPNHLVVLVPQECVTATSPTGTGTIGTSLADGGMTISTFEENYGESVLAHELGHNVGLGHSGGQRCDTLEWECFEDQYADLYDVMGGATRGSVPALNSAHRDDLGLLTDPEASRLELTEAQTTASRTVTLKPRSDVAGLRTLRLVDPETLVPWYVDYRSGTSRDATAGYRAFPDYPAGVTVTSDDGSESFLWSVPTPGEPHSWGPGTTFTSDSGTVSVHVDAVQPGVSATVTVTVASDDPPVEAPEAVAVTGKPEVGTYLHIDRTGWPDAATLRTEWFVGNERVGTFDDLWVSPAWRGQHVQAVVTATMPGHRGVVRRSALIGPVTQPVTGSVQITASQLGVGKPVTSTVSTTPSDAQRVYQWFVDGDLVSGATTSSYTPVAADAGGVVTLRVTASRAGWDTTVLTSNALGPVPVPLQPGSPTIDGTPTVGSALTVDPGDWPAGTTWKYQWRREGSPISGATGASYVPRAADVWEEIDVRVTGTWSGQQASATSPGVTIGLGTLTAGTPTVSGRAKVGKRLTARPGAWTSGTTLAYQWLADGRAVRRATSATLKLTKAHVGKRMSVRVTGSKPGYTGVARTSAPTGKVRR